MPSVKLTQAQFDLAVDQIVAANFDQDCKLATTGTAVRGSKADLWTLFERMSTIGLACDEQGDWRQRDVAKRATQRLYDVAR
jgi:hypothetical protein